MVSGRRPHLIGQVRELLENSPATSVERQRVRILRALNAGPESATGAEQDQSDEPEHD